MLQQTLKRRRIISGILTASMVLSMFTGFGGAAATEAEARSAVNHVKQVRDVQNLSATPVAASKLDAAAGIPMPLSLSTGAMGFYEGMEEQEVTAYMTDLWYLGLLTVDEYAAFFPVTLDLDRVDYISHQFKNYIGQLKEADRLALRAKAEAKLDLKEQFIWDAVIGEEDHSEDLSFEPVEWSIYEATQTSAPMIACKVKVKWTGEKPVNTEPAANGGLQDMLNGAADGSQAGTKNIADESPEVQEFLRQMYAEGLTQDRSPYDLSAFENENTDTPNFNLLGRDEDEETPAASAGNTEGTGEAAPMGTSEGVGEDDIVAPPEAENTVTTPVDITAGNEAADVAVTIPEGESKDITANTGLDWIPGTTASTFPMPPSGCG